MCSQFSLKTTSDELNSFGINIPETLVTIDERYLPYKKAPAIVVDSNSHLKLTGMNFSLVPSWSKEAKVKFATHNARIETITEKPTWKKPFESQHCIIPLTGFFESVYEGEKAGHVIEFQKPDHTLLFAAGIFDKWIDPIEKNNSFFSFSILTTEPTKFILDNGHDRSPIFLNFEFAKTWLALKESPKSLVEFLLTNNQKPELTVLIDRPLKAGWEKRK